MADDLQSVDDSTKKMNWSNLPSLLLEKICTFLCRTDQANLSLVCSRWLHIFDSPSLWRTFRFALTEMTHRKNLTVFKYAEDYRHLIKHVDVDCCYISEEPLIHLWVQRFETFLRIWREKSDLTSIKFQNFECCFRKADHNARAKVYGMIHKLLLSQRQLKRLEFNQFSVNYTDGVTLLNQAIIHTRTCLSHLSLRDFVHKRVYHECALSYSQGLTRQQIQPFIFGLPNLVNLETDYSIIFDDDGDFSNVLDMLKNYQNGLHLKVWLSLDYSMNGFKILTSDDWRILKEANPLLQVEIVLFTSPTLKNMNETFIVPNMPITFLDYKFWDPHFYGEVNAFMQHLLSCNTNRHLVNLSMTVARIIPRLVDPFKQFLKACKKLKSLELSLTERWLDLEILLKFFLENRPESLQRLYLKVREISAEKVATMHKNLAVEYEKLFKSVNVEFRMKFQP